MFVAVFFTLMDRVNLVAKLMVNMTKLIGDGVTVWLLLVARFILLDHAPNNVVYDQVPVLVSLEHPCFGQLSPITITDIATSA